MKAREVKRARLAAKYAAKRAELKKIVNSGVDEENRAEAYEAAQKLQSLPKNSNPIRSTTAAPSQAVPKDTSVSSASLVFSSVRWLLQDSSLASRKHPGKKILPYEAAA